MEEIYQENAKLVFRFLLKYCHDLLDVLKDMQNLPEQMREVIYLRTMAELSFKEIGEILGKSENWARVTFYRGKERLLREKK